jgi:hypothetical protein
MGRAERGQRAVRPAGACLGVDPPDQRPGPLLAEAARDALPPHRSLQRRRLSQWCRCSSNQAPRSSNQAPRSIGRRANGPTSRATTPNVPITGRFIIRWCIAHASGCVSHSRFEPPGSASEY